MYKTVVPVTLYDLRMIRDAILAVRSYDAKYAASPDPLYSLGRKLGPRKFDPDYKALSDEGSAAYLSYLVDLLTTLPNLTSYSSYITGATLKKIPSVDDSMLTEALFEGAWVATLIEYLDLVCPCFFQKTVTYEGGPRPPAPGATDSTDPIYGTMILTVKAALDKQSMLLQCTLEEHVMDGPLPYFDDFIGALYTEDDKLIPYTTGDFLMEIGKLSHDNRDKLWRFDSTVVNQPYMTQFGVFIKNDEVSAKNSPGVISSSLWLNDWDEHKGKVHSPTILHAEDWYVLYNMIPHSAIEDILDRASTTITVETKYREYSWYGAAETPWDV